jgi:malonyl-CoA O-methyltransferase
MWQRLGKRNMPRIGKTFHLFGLKRSAMFAKDRMSIIEAMSEPSSPDAPPSLDPVASARWAVWPHATSPWLNEEIGRRMEERLQWIRLQPTSWVDWAPVSGGLQTHAKLRARYPQALCQVMEPTPAREALARQSLQAPWWKRWLQRNALEFRAPATGSADMLWANMALHTTADPQALLQKWHQLLAVDGFLMFSCLGPDTLRELAEVYQNQGWTPACHAFTDMHDWGDMLVQAGFAEPVMDMERITLTYASPESLLAEFRALGRNLHRDRFVGLRGKQWLTQLKTALLSLAEPQQDGRLSLTVEVIYGHALKPLPRLKVLQQSSVSLQDMRTLLGQSLSHRSV